jgi:hypothetical protein
VGNSVEYIKFPPIEKVTAGDLGRR